MSVPTPLPSIDAASLDSTEVWRALTRAHRALAELKGLCLTLPNPPILIDTLSIQEAKDSSEIENIVTTHDELYSTESTDDPSLSPAAKEVKHYVAAMKIGFEQVAQSGLIRLETLLAVQSALEGNQAGLRKLPGTVLKNSATGETIYEPPQSALEVERLMENLIAYIHEDDGLDPLLRMAVAHHQFESIHPFYDGNGRTGRILNLLVLQREGLLDLPVLYLSRYITSTKPEYYRLLQNVRLANQWRDWCLYMVRGIMLTARHEIRLILSLRDLMLRYKHEIRAELPGLYNQDLLNNLFRYPYTKTKFLMRDLNISRPTATKYLEQLAKAGFLRKRKIGRTNFFINEPLFDLLSSIRLDVP